MENQEVENFKTNMNSLKYYELSSGFRKLSLEEVNMTFNINFMDNLDDKERTLV